MVRILIGIIIIIIVIFNFVILITNTIVFIRISIIRVSFLRFSWRRCNWVVAVFCRWSAAVSPVFLLLRVDWGYGTNQHQFPFCHSLPSPSSAVAATATAGAIPVLQILDDTAVSAAAASAVSVLRKISRLWDDGFGTMVILSFLLPPLFSFPNPMSCFIGVIITGDGTISREAGLPVRSSFVVGLPKGGNNESTEDFDMSGGGDNQHQFPFF